MKNELLQPLLKAGLLNIGDSDERLDNIEKSISDVENLLKENLGLIPSYTLVALDPNIGADEPVLIEVEAIIAEHWKALRAKFTETPVQIIRAVIINALYNIGKEDTRIARIVYLKAINLYPFVKLKKEKDVIEQLITEFGDISEENASEEWQLESEAPELKISPLKIDNLSFEEVEIDNDELKDGLKIAANKTQEGYNAYQHTELWSTHFSEKAADSISNTVNAAFSEFSSSVSADSIEKPINTFFTAFKSSLNQILEASFNSMQAVERRSKLLWWKETLYSSSLKNSYRSVNEIQQAVIMSKDLYEQLPSVVPASVDYLLRDTLLLLNSKAGKKAKFSEHLAEIAKGENQEILKNHLTKVQHQDKRISVTDFITLLVYGEAVPSSFKHYTGIDDTNQVSLLDISVMILHDLMGDYLTKHI